MSQKRVNQKKLNYSFKCAACFRSGAEEGEEGGANPVFVSHSTRVFHFTLRCFSCGRVGTESDLPANQVKAEACTLSPVKKAANPMFLTLEAYEFSSSLASGVWMWLFLVKVISYL